ncbi:MAG: hypothetical protein P8Y49_09120, partial [Sulfurovaceae bacterium]
VVNSDIPNTTLVGAWVRSANSQADLGDFNKLNNSDGVFMLTGAYATDAFNVTGTGYYAQDFAVNDLYAAWVDAGFNISDFNIGAQAGYISDISDVDNTYALGAKFSGTFDPVTVGAAVTWVNDGDTGVINLGGGRAVDSWSTIFGDNALYTTSPLGSNVMFNSSDATSVLAKVGVDLPVGHLCVIADYSSIGNNSVRISEGDFYEGAIAYNVVLGDLDLTAGYVYQNVDIASVDDDTNVIRVVARYNF